MTVATLIEIVTGGHPEPGQSQVLTKTPGKAPSAAWAGAPASSLSPSFVPGTQSSWQSLLASLGAGLDGLSEEGTETHIKDTVGEAFPAGAAGRASGASPLPVGAAAPQRNTAILPLAKLEEQSDGSAAGGASVTRAGSRAGIAVSRDAAGVARQAAADPAGKHTENANPAEPSTDTRAAEGRKGAKLQPASAEAVVTPASTLPEIVSSAMPASGFAYPPANTAESQKQTSASNLSTGLPESAIREPLQRTPSNAGSPGSAAGLTSPAGGHAADQGPAVANASHNASATGDSLNRGVSSAPSGQGEVVSAGEESPGPGRTESHAEYQPQTIPQGQNAIQAQYQTQEVKTVEVPASNLAPSPSPTNADPGLSQSSPPLAMSPMAGKPEVAGSARSTGPTMMRLAHVASPVEAAQQENHLLGGHAGSSALDGSTLSRDLAGVPGAGNTSGNMAGASPGAAAGAGSRETFAALDAGTTTVTPTWIHAGAQRAEAGFQDPALGWIGVRADGSGGGIHAALVPGSADAAQALGGHLAGLNAYLAEQHTPVESLTLAAPESRSAEAGTDQSASQGMHPGAGQNSGQDGYAEPQSNTQASSPANTVTVLPEISAQASGLDGTGPAARPGGVHISVMA
ncbi:MAG: hypothetical protein ABSC88_09610 [Terracidiphilus sp.]|jgi:hypothetical protein